MHEIANIKVYFKCPADEKALFKSSSCALGTSIGQRDQYGPKFGATVYAVNKYFKECTIMLCDSLQRLNFRKDENDDLNELHMKANTLGENWLKNNEKYFSLFDIPYQVLRWDFWLHHKNYSEARKKN